MEADSSRSGGPSGAARTVRILIADDHAIVREGLKFLLRSVADFEVAGEAEDGFAAVRLARELRPDVVLLDIYMPRMNGLHAARRMRQENGDLKILALSAQDDAKMIRLLLQCGVSGYILKNDLIPELVSAIRTVHAGEVYLSSRLTKIKLPDGNKRLGSFDALLDPRQREILELQKSGASLEEIARQTMLSVRTVQRHLKRIESIASDFGANAK